MDPSISPLHSVRSLSPKPPPEPLPNDTPHSRKLFWSYLIAGLLISIPWGVITNSIDFFEHHLRGTAYGEAFLSHFATVFLTAKLGFMFVALRLQKNQRKNNKKSVWAISPRSQCLLGAFGIMCVMIAFCILVMISPNLRSFSFYLVVLGASVGASLSSGLLEAGLYILAGQAQHITAVLIGQSSSALFCSIISFIFISSLSSVKPSWFALGNFGIAMAISLITIFLLDSSPLGIGIRQSEEVQQHQEEAPPVQSRAVLRKCSAECASVFFLALFSLIVHMFLISKTWSTSSSGTIRLLFRPAAFLTIALADFASKLVTLDVKFRYLNLPLLPSTLARFALVPFFLFGNIRSSSGRSTALPSFLANDVLFFVVVIVFSFTGGYMSTIASIQATLKVQDHERGRASFLVGASGLAGALCGALISAALAAVIF